VKKTATFLEKWGHYLLALLCAGVILLSAVWQGEMKQAQEADYPAGADQAQRLEDAKMLQDERCLLAPVEGEILRPFSEEIAFDTVLGLWRIHPAIDFKIKHGETVRAMASGVTEIREKSLIIRHENGDYSVYRGLARIDAQNDQRVKAGDAIGIAGGNVPMEGNGDFICIGYYRQDTPVNFQTLFINP